MPPDLETILSEKASLTGRGMRFEVVWANKAWIYSGKVVLNVFA